MATRGTGQPRTPEEVRQARGAVIGGAIGLVVVLLACAVYAIASGKYWLLGALIAISAGSGCSLWIAWRSAQEPPAG